MAEGELKKKAAGSSPQGSGYKTLAVLRQFAGNAADLGVTDISEMTGMDKTSV